MTVEELREEANKLGYIIIKRNPTRIAKYQKCGQCKYLTGEVKSIGIRCMNPDKVFQNDSTAPYKYKCQKACKLFENK